MKIQRAAGIAVATAVVSITSGVLTPGVDADSAQPRPTITGISLSSGRTAGGGHLIIRGRDLTTAFEVKFGRIRVNPVHVRSSGRLDVVVPAHTAGTVHVSVRNHSGVSRNTTADRFRYVAPPQVLGLGPSTGHISGGEKVTVRGANLTGATAVSFGSVHAAAFRVLGDSRLRVTAPPQAPRTVNVRVSTPYGRSAIRATDKFGYFVAPTITSVTSPRTFSVEAGRPQTLTVVGTNFGSVASLRIGGHEATHVAVKSRRLIRASFPSLDPGSVTADLSTAYGSASMPLTIRQAVAAGFQSDVDFASGVRLSWTLPQEPWTPTVTIRRGSILSPPQTPDDGEPVAIPHPEQRAVEDTDVLPHHTYSYSLFLTDPAGNTSLPFTITTRTWRSVITHFGSPTPVGDDGVVDLSCSTTEFCAAVDHQANAIFETNGVWGSPHPVAGAAELDEISCASDSFCVAAGRDSSGNPVVATYGGNSWSTPHILTTMAPDSTPTALDCASAAFCMVIIGQPGVDAQGPALFSRFDGSVWSAPAAFGTRVADTGLDCTDSTFCVTDGAFSDAQIWDGDSWHLSRVGGAATVSCASREYCVTAGVEGSLWNGTAWETGFDGPDWVNSLSCSSAAQCVGIGGPDADLIDFDGSGWSSYTEFIGGPLAALDCAPSGPCTVITRSGDAYRETD